MEKQYSTHYLPEKYRQHQFIDIYNFEITVLKTQSTVQRQKSQGNEIFDFFFFYQSTWFRPSNQLSKTAQTPASRNNNGKTIVASFFQLLSVNFITELEPPRIRTRYLLASYVLQKFVNIKGACILHLILVGILAIHFDLVH